LHIWNASGLLKFRGAWEKSNEVKPAFTYAEDIGSN
jgi:hypothetical protein